MRKVSSSCRIERKQKANICLRRDKESPYRLCVKWITTARHCRDCKSTVVVHSGADFQPAGNKRNRKAGDPALLQGSLCDPRKSAFGYFSRFGEKYHPSPCYGKQERSCSSSKRKEDYSFSKGKGEGRSFCTVTKGTKNTEKGRRLPLPFSNPTPLTNEGKATFPVCAKFPGAAG